MKNVLFVFLILLVGCATHHQQHVKFRGKKISVVSANVNWSPNPESDIYQYNLRVFVNDELFNEMVVKNQSWTKLTVPKELPYRLELTALNRAGLESQPTITFYNSTPAGKSR
jgi:hypothetical protein